MPAPGPQAVLLLFTARLAPSRLFSPRPHRPRRGTAGAGRVAAVHRVHERPASRAVDELRRDRRHLGRPLAGSPPGAVATRGHLPTDSSPAASAARPRQYSPPPAPG